MAGSCLTQRSLENALLPAAFAEFLLGGIASAGTANAVAQSACCWRRDSSRSQRWCNICRKTSALSSGNKSYENSHGPTPTTALSGPLPN